MIKKKKFIRKKCVLYGSLLYFFFIIPSPYKPCMLGEVISRSLYATYFGLHGLKIYTTYKRQPYLTMSSFLRSSAHAVEKVSYWFDASCLKKDFLDYIDLKKHIPRICLAIGIYCAIQWFNKKE